MLLLFPRVPKESMEPAHGFLWAGSMLHTLTGGLGERGERKGSMDTAPGFLGAVASYCTFSMACAVAPRAQRKHGTRSRLFVSGFHVP